MAIFKNIYFGNTRRKIDKFELLLSEPSSLPNGYFQSSASITGLPSSFNRSLTRSLIVAEIEKKHENPLFTELREDIEASSEFDVLVLSMAYFRQILRGFAEQNPKIKFYEKLEEELIEREIADIFWTHDCVPDND